MYSYAPLANRQENITGADIPVQNSQFVKFTDRLQERVENLSNQVSAHARFVRQNNLLKRGPLNDLSNLFDVFAGLLNAFRSYHRGYDSALMTGYDFRFK